MAKKTLYVVLLLTFVLPAAPARAGGALLDLDREFYVAGDVVRAHSAVWLESSQGRLDDGPFFAYLHEPSPDYPPPVPEDALRVAPVEIVERPDGEHGDASAEFVLPLLEPGRYLLTLCNDPCTKTLGDIMSTEVVVASSDSEGRIVMVQDQLRFRLRSLHARVRNHVLGSDARSLRSRITELENEVARLAKEVDVLGADARPSPPAPSGGSAAVPALLAFVVPAAALGIVLARRSRGAV